MAHPLEHARAAVRTLGNAYASVLFGAGPGVGLVLLAVTLNRPASGVGGLIAVVTATLVAKLLGYRPDAIRSGLYGYNALLVGLAVLHGRSLTTHTVALDVLAGAASTLLTAVLGDALQRGLGLPTLVLPFVLLGALLSPALEALGPPVGAPWLDDLPLWEPDLRDVPPRALAVLRDFGALFFQPSPLAGLVVLGVSLWLSRIATVALLAGVGVAAVMGEVFGSHWSSDVGLSMAYNSALASLAIGAFFFVPSRASLAAGVGAAALASWLTVTLSPIFQRLGLPLLAWPFVLVALVTLRALHLRAPDRPPFPSPLPGLPPEANLDHALTFSVRFGIPGPPRLYLPVAGRWAVSQGVDGDHTHRGAWAHAWDLEILDDRGFPFRGDGARREDYLCFGAPVYAPGAGTVVAVHEGAPDGQPGELDTVRPFGNAVVLQHGAELFSVVAHLRSGSVLVKPGEVVVAGQPLAACGSSGRSPRPHVHLQAQRTPELGAAAVPSQVASYLVLLPDGGQRFVHSGIPREGERVSNPTRSPVVDAFSALPLGLEVVLDPADGGAPVRLRSEVTLVGERYLRDLDRGDRLYFTTAGGDLAFTTHAGPAGTPLRALFLALPRLPSAAGARTVYEDRPPPAVLLARPLRALHDLVRFLVDPLETRAELEIQEQAASVVVRSRTSVGLRGLPRPAFRGEVHLDARGLQRFELADERGRGCPVRLTRRG